ncbi:MAG: D-alanyl-D-alanine carboxypeptidase family protein [Firmicutes bacterium]|nr:D-alanyl-D-alanine carboxypeptidase family protein [Bacillota bacterium]
MDESAQESRPAPIRRRRRRRRRSNITAVYILAAVLAALIALAIFLKWPRSEEGAVFTTSGDGSISAAALADGTVRLDWTAAENADGYLVEVFPLGDDGTADESVLYYRADTPENACTLRALDGAGECLLRVTAYTLAADEQTQIACETPLQAALNFDTPLVDSLSWEVEADTLSVSFALLPGDRCCVCLLIDGEIEQLLAEVDGDEWSLAFGEDALLPIPEAGEEITIGFYAAREQEGIAYTGPISAQLSLCEENFLGCELNAAAADEGDNVYTLTWQQTKGETFAVQRQDDDGEWITVATRAAGEEMCYTTEHLAAFHTYSYRIAALGGEAGEGIFSETLSIETQQSVIYATIWPVRNLTAYADPEMTEEVSTATAMQAYCVLAEAEGAFGIRLDGELCYISSDYCMINLPEYIGELCAYNITNSYDSLYMVHEFEIPTVTGTVITGYEDVCLADGSFLVPLLYPAACKLLVAAQTAQELGYRLKIYDSFRPNKATTRLYSIASALLEEVLPDGTYTGVPISSLNLPEQTVITGTLEDGTEVEAKVPLTYAEIMLGNYTLNYYLAAGYSKHNLGIAMDLTMENLETGEEISMQTSLHDLSHYSALSENTYDADTLSSIMISAGFTGLSSEWWHFQDNDALNSLNISPVTSGVSVQGWTADDGGWRYRLADGSYYAACTAAIDEVEYAFDADGYVIAE